jgi:hypothetical protein
VSNRLSTTPCVIVASKFGQTANMERIMKAQALGDAGAMAYMRGQRTLEVNPRHPLIQALLVRGASWGTGGLRTARARCALPGRRERGTAPPAPPHCGSSAFKP